MKNKNDEWENRVLCSDGNCIGVIGPDGRCKECGKPYEGDENIYVDDQDEKVSEKTDLDEETEIETETSGSDIQDELTETDDDSPVETDEDKHSNFDDEWENRTLCSDGNCIGVIGPNGRCKECGKRYKG